MLMMKKPKNLELEPLHPKNVLLASVVHGISCLFEQKFGIPSFITVKFTLLFQSVRKQKSRINASQMVMTLIAMTTVIVGITLRRAPIFQLEPKPSKPP
jgi:hypothetical protein